MLWIINDNIEFNPGKNKLVSLSKPELSVILTAPASRCLVLLLESAPDVVPQKDFFTYVWAEDGVFVPANTLYQNISIIRRGLRATGETDDILVATVPRRGFQIGSGVKVSRSTTEDNPAENLTDSVSPNELSVTGSEAGIVNNLVVQTRKICQQFRRYIPLLLMLTSFGLGVLLSQPLWSRGAEKDFFKTYTLSTIENGCHFFSRSDDIKDRGTFTKFKDVIIQTGLDCKKYPWVYFPSSTSAPALSALICPEPYEKLSNSRCVTLYFRGK